MSFSVGSSPLVSSWTRRWVFVWDFYRNTSHGISTEDDTYLLCHCISVCTLVGWSFGWRHWDDGGNDGWESEAKGQQKCEKKRCFILIVMYCTCMVSFSLCWVWVGNRLTLFLALGGHGVWAFCGYKRIMTVLVQATTRETQGSHRIEITNSSVDETYIWVNHAIPALEVYLEHQNDSPTRGSFPAGFTSTNWTSSLGSRLLDHKLYFDLDHALETSNPLTDPHQIFVLVSSQLSKSRYAI